MKEKKYGFDSYKPEMKYKSLRRTGLRVSVIGLGTMVRINDLLIPFAEGKYTVGGYSQPTLIIGVKFQLGDKALKDDY
jgi:hypothetical protein